MSRENLSRAMRLALAICDYLGIEAFAVKGDVDKPLDDDIETREEANIDYDFEVRKKDE